MSKQFFRLLFGTMLFVAAAAFTACTDDDKTEAPELTANPTVLNFTTETALTQTVAITANCEWKVTTSGLEWATVTPAAGKGNATLSVTVGELPADVKARTGKISFTMIHPEFGPWGTAESTVTVNQAGEGGIVPPPDTDPIYFNNFDKAVAEKTYGSGTSYPYLDQFDGWQNQTGTGAANVAYEYTGMSARSNSTSNSNYSDYAGSGSNNLFFGTNAVFTIQNIAVDTKNLQLTFGAERYSQSAGSDFVHEDFLVELSNDGKAWSSPLTYAFAKGVDPSGRWDLATADFTLPDDTKTLYIRFTSKVASVHRLDDVKLTAGVGGQDVTFTGGGDEPGPEPPVTDAIYFNNFDKAVAEKTYGSGSSYPYLDQFDGWQNHAGTGVANVTYSYTGMSARSNSTSDSSYSDYAGSGSNNLFFGANAVFTIEKIAVSTRNLQLTFGAERYSQSAGSDFNHDDFLVELSNNGSAWSSPLTYTFAKGTDPSGRWDLATADFTLPENTTTLYIRFTSKVASVHRLDDVKLTAGAGGQNITFTGGGDEPGPQPSDETKIGKITAAGNYKTTGTVVARGKMAYIIADETGAMMVYHKDNTRAVGEKITIEGAVTIYKATSTPQFSDAANVTVVSKDNAWTYNPVMQDAAAMDALLTAAPVCKEVQFEGLLAISGNYANVTIDGASTAIGSIKYLDNSTISALDKKRVVVKGYFVGTSSNKYVNVLPYSVSEAGGETPATPSITVNPASLSFVAAGETKTVTVTKTNADDCTIAVSVDNAQFTATESNGTVTVVAKENTAETAVSAKLTVSLMKDGKAVDSKTVALSQAAKSTGETTGGGSDDFSTLTNATSYGEQKTTAGWVGKSVAVQSGGDKDNNPMFKSLLGEDANVKGMVINGKTSAVGSITSPVLNGGCGSLSFDYGYAFSESKGVDFKVEIKQNDAVVKTFEVKDAAATKLKKYTFSENVGVSGDFQIVITNNCPSNSSSNKDRYTIFNISWTGNK